MYLAEGYNYWLKAFPMCFVFGKENGKAERNYAYEECDCSHLGLR